MSCPEFSVVIPVYREKSTLTDCLNRLRNLRGIENAEVIVVDGAAGSTVDGIRTYEFEPMEVRTKVVASGRGLQMHAGASLARGDVLIFLHVDIYLPGDFFFLIETTTKRWHAGAFRLSIRSSNPAIRLIGVVGDIRNRLTATPFGDQVHFFRRETYFGVGGYLPIPIMEDVDMMRRLKWRHITVRVVPQYVEADDRRWRKEGIARTTVRNWALLLLYRIGVSPLRLSRFYLPHYE